MNTQLPVILPSLPGVGVNLQLHLGQRVRLRNCEVHDSYSYVVGRIQSLSFEIHERDALAVSVCLDQPIILEERVIAGERYPRHEIWWQHVTARDVEPFSDMDEALALLRRSEEFLSGFEDAELTEDRPAGLEPIRRFLARFPAEVPA